MQQKEIWEREAMQKETMKRQMEQDLTWREIKKREERDEKLQINQGSKVVS